MEWTTTSVRQAHASWSFLQQSLRIQQACLVASLEWKETDVPSAIQLEEQSDWVLQI